MITNWRPIVSLFTALFLSVGAGHASEDLAALDLATLMSMDVTVTSAAKRAQTSADAAAAVYVITREDIRRSGASSLPEVLRLAPGLQVARINTRSWAVTSRGFGSRFANKLLVMVDGRNIYTPTFSGVMWEEQPVFLDSIERIEVVRGPGGALWGINAVNGVINIITRNASDAPGLTAGAGNGSNENAAALRYAGNAARLGDYRFYVEHAQLDSLDQNNTPLTRTLGGFRLDRETFDGLLTFQGDLHHSDFSAFDGLPDSGLHQYSQAGNVLANWQRDVTAGHLELRAYLGWVERRTPGEWNDASLGLDAGFNAQRHGRHLLSAGAGLRRATDRQINPPLSLQSAESEVRTDKWSLYAQDELYFFQDSVRVIAGAKVENSNLANVAVQPTLRTLWNTSDSHTLWAAASRALRTPSRFEMHSRIAMQVPGAPPLSIRLIGTEDLVDEELRAYELGWRWRPVNRMSVDLALYSHEYSNLIGTRALPPSLEFGPPLQLVIPCVYANLGNARTQGAELALEWRARGWLRLQGSGVWYDAGSAKIGGGVTTDSGVVDPDKTFSLRARIELPRNVEMDIGWRAVADLPAFNIAAYQSLDTRIAWRPVDSIELSLAIQNALDDKHAEFFDELAGVPGIVFGRSYLGRIVWQPQRMSTTP